jgi:hypothetical protein
MKRTTFVVAVLMGLALAFYSQGCTEIAATSPSGKSTITYKGSNILSSAALTAGCTSTATMENCSITGVDLAALAAAVAPFVAAALAAQKPAEQTAH